VTSDTGRCADQHRRNRSRSTDVRQSGQDWLSQAQCKGQPTEIFFAADNELGRKLRRNERRAKQICWSCPVLEACRDYALNAQEPYGIWGALTASERRQVRAANALRFQRVRS
jgi:WhiB family transcriptional regulator, redox-sensing transcriptional regulator